LWCKRGAEERNTTLVVKSPRQNTVNTAFFRNRSAFLRPIVAVVDCRNAGAPRLRRAASVSRIEAQRTADCGGAAKRQPLGCLARAWASWQKPRRVSVCEAPAADRCDPRNQPGRRPTGARAAERNERPGPRTIAATSASWARSPRARNVTRRPPVAERPLKSNGRGLLNRQRNQGVCTLAAGNAFARAQRWAMLRQTTS
jgi:hypothetical protein